MSRGLSRGLAALAGLAWCLLCLRWFDVAAAWRPAWLAALPPAVPAGFGLAAVMALAIAYRDRLRSEDGPRLRAAVLGTALLAVMVRLPLAWGGGAGYVTPDGALSGIVALHLRSGSEHLVFVPHVPYSGSLKSHLAAALVGLGFDPARAFALSSVFFYGVFTAVVAGLAGRVRGAGPGAALLAGLYVALAPAFVTRYSLSNDGNYVEVLALGTGALLLAVRWGREPAHRAVLAWLIGLLLGLAFWCHILAVIPAAAAGLALLWFDPRTAVRDLARLLGGFVLGDAPGLLWNAANQGESFQYLLPGHPVGSLAEGPGLLGRALFAARDQLPVLLGYDPGYGRGIDLALRVFAVLGLLALALATVTALVRAREPGQDVLRVLLLLAAIDVALAVGVLPHVPGNPRYLLLLVAPAAVCLATALLGRGRWLMLLLIGAGAITSAAQVPGALRADAQWRRFVADLQAGGVVWCYTDFYLATKIAFLSGEAVTCSAKLGPTTTEYFFEYRRAVEAAPSAALVAVNPTAAEKLERRLQRLGVTYERRDLMKPVLLRLSRKVDPEELFPGHEIPWR